MVFILHTVIIMLLYTTSLTQIKVIIRSRIRVVGVKRRKIKPGKLETYQSENAY